MTQEVKQLIESGTNLITKINDYRRGVCSFDILYDFGFTDYFRWKRSVFDFLNDNGADKTTLDYLYEDDFLNRNYLDLCRQVEKINKKQQILDELTNDIRKLQQKLLDFCPADGKIKIIISKKIGIYRANDKNLCYPITGPLRFNLLKVLNTAGFMEMDSILKKLDLESNQKAVNRAAKEINKLFKRCLIVESDLIFIYSTKNYELNKKSFEIAFQE